LRCVLTFIDAITSLDCPVKNCSFSGRHESAFDVFVAELTGFVLLHLHSIGAARPRWGAALIEPILLVELLNCTGTRHIGICDHTQRDETIMVLTLAHEQYSAFVGLK